MTKLVYADYAAATPTDERVADRVRSITTAVIGNPSSAHGFGHAAWIELNEARQTVADFLRAKTHEIYFTASGTESNNLAILGVAKANKNRGNHIITTTIEHPSVMNACRALERDGFEVTYLPVKMNGQIDPRALQAALRPTTVLVTFHLANSEIGVVQDVTALANLIKRRNSRTLVHVDACQATSYLPLNVENLGVDLLTFNGSKCYGPRGVAVLYVRTGTVIFPIVYGGGQEQSLRSGTENVPGIVGLAAAVRIIIEQRDKDAVTVGNLRDDLQSELEKLPKATVNAKTANRLPNHLSVTFGKIRNSDLVKLLDQHGIAVSAGSACSAKSLVESHVLSAIGLTAEQAQATLRITLGRQTTKQDCQQIVSALKTIIK